MIPCGSCGFSNLPLALFCGGCGQPLNPTLCSVCNAANPGINRFCNQCGTAISASAVPAENAIPAPSAETPPDARMDAARRIAWPDAIYRTLRTFALAFLAKASASAPSATALLSRNAILLLIAGALAVVLAQLGLTFSVELNRSAPLGYLLLLALGAGLFSLGSLGLWARRSIEGTASPDLPHANWRSLGMFDSATGTVGVLIGILAVAALIVPLGAGSVSGYLLLPWVVALVAFSTPFLLQLTPVAVLSQAWVRKHYADVAAVITLLAFFIALNTYDLSDWYYSAIGDEYLFLEHAKHMAEQGITHPFSQEGVYNHHPVMSSVYQAMVMWVFGADYYGWTLSSLLSAALTIPGIYLLGNNLGGRKTALFATVLFAVSHYIWAGTHIGNTILTPLPVSVWSIALFVSGWRNGNPLLLYAAGVIAGLGFYTHYSARAILPVMMLFAVTSGNPRRLPGLWPLLLGFALTVAPTFVVEQEQVFARMFGQVVGGYSDVVSGSVWDRILSNIQINLPAFNYNSTVHSYVYGPLLDPVSAALAVLGIGFALGHVRQASFRLLLIWFSVAAIMTGVLSPYPHVAITRLAFVVPPLTLLAGMLAGQIGNAIHSEATRLGGRFPRVFVPGLFAALLAVALALNLWQFRQVTPSVFPHVPEAVAMGAFRSQSCGSDLAGTVFVGRATSEGSLLERMMSAFQPDEPLPRRMNHDEIIDNGTLPALSARCVIFVNPDTPEARTLQEHLARQYPDGRVMSFTNPSETTTVEIFARGSQ